ncbi:hypothetical protein ACH50O_23455 (plasmid) [Methylomonas sp. 2BW1-5-20]|uniref:hypothetical protein n=1 Tax=Methylomonas sp. 2BW1-5-20 TaxID=3376686 RepID=UPI00404ED0AF
MPTRFFLIAFILLLISCSGLKKQPSSGLTRFSFGGLNGAKIEKGTSNCNENIGYGVDKALKESLGKLFDPVRNLMGKPDETLVKDEIMHHFSFTNSVHPVISVIDRTDYSIDFWFKDDAVGEVYRADQAAQDYCMSRDNKNAVYVGFSFRCGNNIAVPLSINGQFIQVREEEVIVAYNCMPVNIKK